MATKARVDWQGLAEFRQLMRQWPQELRGQARKIVQGHANAAAVKVRSNYASHRHTGRLQDSVVVEHQDSGPLVALSTVRAKAKHAHLFEFGTAARHTSKGIRRGVMPPAPPLHAFIPTVERQRRLMVQELIALLQREGLVVTGA